MHAHMALLSDPAVRIGMRFMDELTANLGRRDFAVRFWDGSIWGETVRPRFTLDLKHPAVMRDMFLAPSEVTLGEAYIYDDIDIEGNIGSVFELADAILVRENSFRDKLWFSGLLSKLVGFPKRPSKAGPAMDGELHSKERDRAAVAYHYDTSNDFFSLWLDRRMVYSCAYFRSADDDLDTAQEQKLDYICRKLRLQRGDRILDLGCGWGALMIHAARNYGVHAFGITLSVPQAELARERIRTAGFADRCKVAVCDYRELDPPQQYDKIVSVGMFEHVGEALLPQYFRRAWDVLRPGGIFLNHGIAVSSTAVKHGPSFVDKYVFPDGELVPIATSLRVAEACGWEVRDVESLREHYAITLKHWVERLEAKAEHARKTVGEVTYRIWRLYMSGSAHRFAAGQLNLYQVLFSKPDHGNSRLPLTRQDWYAV
jgi:cyclopropane-fatty-acyl-phospholipid synthase